MNNIMNRILDLMFVREHKCCICGLPAGEVLCDKCAASIPYLNGATCLKCGKGLNDAYNSSICPDCSNTEYHFDMAYSCFEYKEAGKELIHKLKYEGKTEAAVFIARQMHYRLKDERLQIDAIVPVPIHESKLRTRGFNQSYLIAKELGSLMDKPVYDCICRIKETKNQYNLDRQQRFSNIQDAFSVKLGYNVNKYKRLLIVDDIYTTGSTVNECSKVLKARGNVHIYVITAAAGTNT